MTKKYTSIPSKIFDTGNYIFLAILTISCLLPVIHTLAVSLSDKAATSANLVEYWPIGFQTMSYQKVLTDSGFLDAFMNSVYRVVAGTAVNIFLICITAYPLSLEANEFKGRNVFMWLLVIPMLFSGGLIPTYLVVRDTGLIGSFWALVIPGAVQVFSVIIMMNFFRSLPKSMYEAAAIDGASHMRILWQIFVPLSMPSIATLSLFAMLGHWNDWFSGIIYLSDTKKWPLQTYLRQMLIPTNVQTMMRMDDIGFFKYVSERNLTAAQIFISMIPIMCVYPFLQKYFVQGIVLGSVKE